MGSKRRPHTNRFILKLLHQRPKDGDRTFGGGLFESQADGAHTLQAEFGAGAFQRMGGMTHAIGVIGL